MAIVDQRSGCRVGWVTFDNEEEARQRAATELSHGERMVTQGYDFGFQMPGELKDHGNGTYTVTTV